MGDEENSDKSDTPTRSLSRATQRKECKARFLVYLREDPNVSLACEYVGIHRDTAYAWRNSDQKFAKEWDNALERTRDIARSSIYRRGILGWDEKAHSNGQVVMEYESVVDEEGNQRFDERDRPLVKGGVPLLIRKYSDTLASLYARKNLPEYGDKPQLNIHAQLADLAEQRRQKVLAELDAAIKADENEESPGQEEGIQP